MTTTFSRPLRLAALATSVSLGLLLPVSSAAAAGDGDVAVTNTETVQVYTDANGTVHTKRIYEQLAFTGSGTVDLQNPISTDGLRNLDGFGGVDVKAGKQLVKVDVDGEKRLRYVSNYDGSLPLEVKVKYLLDGKEVSPGDVVGKDGRLEVLYTVRNVTASPQEVSFPDGAGGTTTKTVDVPIPVVSSVTTTLPPTFTDVTSKQANMAGDGRNGTKLSFTLTLFPPIGSDTAEIGYTATIRDGVVPRTEITALPVNPLDVPTFANAAKSYAGGADTGVQLADGATTIDTNLLKLRDGSAKLLAGLIQLRDGAGQLETGLAGQAAPGAEKLADGAGKLDDGLGQLDAGGKKLAAGAGEAASGSKKLAAGTQQLKSGVGKLGDGASQLAGGQAGLVEGLQTLRAGVEGLPASVKAELAKNPDYQSALMGIQLAIIGIGNDTDVTDPKTGQPATLLGGLNAVIKGLEDARTGPAGAPGTLATLKAAITSIASTPACAADPTCVGTVDAVAKGVDAQLVSALQQAVGGLTKVKGGLSNPNADPAKCAQSLLDPARKCGIKQVLQALYAGVPQLVDQLTVSISEQLLAGIGTQTTKCDPTKTLLCGAAALADGGQQLVDGVGQLSDGSVQLADGAGQLSDGLGQLDAGAQKLSDGMGQAADGSGQLADGAGQLADGLKDAANGSSRLAEGLQQAAGGAPQLVDGAQRLSDEGTKKLVAAGEDTAQSYGEMYATIEAGAQRADAEKMAFGAPDGAQALMAYSYVIEGEDGEGGRNLTRGLAGVALLGAGAVAFGLRRRIV